MASLTAVPPSPRCLLVQIPLLSWVLPFTAARHVFLLLPVGSSLDIHSKAPPLGILWAVNGVLSWRSPSVKRVSRKLPRHLRIKPSCQEDRTTLSESLLALNLNVSTFPPTKRNTSTVSTAWLWVVMDVGSRLTWVLKGFRAKMLAVGATPGWRGRIGKRQLKERHCPSEGSCGRNTAKSLLRNHKNAP